MNAVFAAHRANKSLCRRSNEEISFSRVDVCVDNQATASGISLDMSRSRQLDGKRPMLPGGSAEKALDLIRWFGDYTARWLSQADCSGVPTQ